MKEWCGFLQADALGLLFLEPEESWEESWNLSAQRVNNTMSVVSPDEIFPEVRTPQFPDVEGRPADALSGERQPDAVNASSGGRPADAVGALPGGRPEYLIHGRLTPLVYVPAADTLFWESACGSGTSAVAAWMSRQLGKPITVSLQQPGGILTASASQSGSLMLIGTVQYLYERTASVEI